MGAEQLALPGVPRRRARLEDEDRGDPGLGDAVPAGVAAAPEMAVDVEGLIGYSRWDVNPPPCDGWWDVGCDGKVIGRWWFSGSKGPLVWFTNAVPVPGRAPTAYLMHDEFLDRNLMYRGLREPALSYPSPPYPPADVSTGTGELRTRGRL